MSRLFRWMTIAWTWSWKRGPWIPCRRKDTTVRLCYFASPCNKSDFDHVAYVNHMIPLALFYRDMLGACLCIRSAYPLKETQVSILTIGHGKHCICRIIFNSLRPNVESWHSTPSWWLEGNQKNEWPHKNCLMVETCFSQYHVLFAIWLTNISSFFCCSVSRARPADRLLIHKHGMTSSQFY